MRESERKSESESENNEFIGTNGVELNFVDDYRMANNWKN